MTNSTSPISIAEPRGVPGAGKIVIARLRDLALLPALALLIVIGAIVSPVFLTAGNINTILTSSAALALVVLAESLIIITGKFDLSLESIYGFAPAIGAMTVVPAAKFGFGFELPSSVGILVVLLVGGLIGFINGFMVVRLRLSAFIVTLAMLIILRGMLVGATSGRTLFDLPDAFYGLMVITFLGLPLAVWLAAFAFVIAGLVLRYHRLGRALLRHRRQPRGSPRRRHPRRAHHLGRLRAGRHAGGARRPRSPATSARSAPTRATASSSPSSPLR